MLARWIVVDEQFTRRVKEGDFPKPYTHTRSSFLTREKLLDLFDSQLKSRHLDLIARVLKEQNQSFYTIGSSGHEGNAAIAEVFAMDDPACLHYRSGAFFIQRAKKNPTIDPVRDILLSLVCAEADPIAAGRHKVFGSLPLAIPPQTSTIASHTPKSLGVAMALTRMRKLGANHNTLSNKDKVVLCSFGDASFNHSTCQGTLNATQWLAYNHFPLPLVFICEDNGIGISTPTPKHWIRDALQSRPGLAYLSADGLNLHDVFEVAQKARGLALKGQPVFLHVKVKRLMGHAGSDIETHYWNDLQIEQNEADDPLLHTARLLIEDAHLSADQIVARYESVREAVQQCAASVVQLPRLSSAQAVMASIIPPHKALEQTAPDFSAPDLLKHPLWQDRKQRTLTLAQQINLGLVELMTRYPQAVCFGEDVAKKGGVYRVTANLQTTLGAARVFDTLLDEQTILGTAIGFGLMGLLPIPEIQFLAYVHNAEDQIRGEAATCSFFSSGQYTNPMLIRIAGLAYQKGFGGHFHNDNAFAFLREIPGIIIACPSDGARAVKLLRHCAILVAKEQRVVVFLEPIALYHEKECLTSWPDFEESIAMEQVQEEGEASAGVAIVTYGNGVLLSRQAVELEQLGARVKIIDLCWLSPLPFEALKKALQSVEHVMIVDECRRTGSLSEQLMTWMLESYSKNNMLSKTFERVTAEDCFIPLGDSWRTVLPSVSSIQHRLQAYFS